ncbi:Ig-like domain-containing protein [Pedobacter sp. UYP24]
MESFRAATAPGVTFGGAPSAFLTASGSSVTGGNPIDPVGQGYLRLTNNIKNQKGYVFSNSNFPSNNGLRVEFEYYIYGGTGADGISFFLFDATADPFTIGGFGGSLGYAQINTTNPISPGVSKGYLAIGLDEFGNFSNPNEGRQGGTGQFPGSVTLRGKGDGSSLTQDNYKFLTTSLVSNSGFSLVGDGIQRQSLSSSPGYRKVLMEMEPNPAGGYNITVKITRGGQTLTTATVISNYYYPEAAPANLRYGFASSTGDQTNYHEVRNVAIEVYNSNSLLPVVATNDVFAACTGNIATFDVSLNDRTDNAGAVLINSQIDLNPNINGIQNTFPVNGKGTFAVAQNGNIIFTPSAIFTGPVTANYTIKDSYGKESNSASITLNYSDPTVYPVAGPDKIANISTNPASSSLEGSEHVGYTGSWTQVSGPSNATFTNPTNKNTFINNLIGGIYVFRWTIRNSSGCESSDDVQITVNNRPVAVNENISTNLNTDITIPVLDNDTDLDGNTTIDKGSLIIKTQPQNGTLVVDLVTGKVIYRPNNGYTGSDSFTYTIKDNYGAESNIATVVIGVSLKPIGFNDNANTITNAPITINVLANDPDKNGATVISDTSPSHGSIIINNDGTIVYTPATGFSGRDVFTYKLKNSGNIESDPITVTVSVKPLGTVDSGTTLTNQPLTIVVKNNDLSSVGTSVIVTTNPLNGIVTTNLNGVVLFTPNPGYSGKDSFTYFLRTADGLDSDPILVSLNVKPIGTNDNIITPINVSASVIVKDNDLSKVGTTVGINTNPVNGNVIVNANNVAVYTPNSGFSGQDSFTYLLKTTDGVNSDPITVNISIKPVGSPDEVTTPTNTAIPIAVKDNDVSKTNTTVILNNPPLNGTFSVNASGVVTYTPNDGFSGKDNFNYILRTLDGFESEPIAVVVNIKPAGTTDNVGAVNTIPVNIDVKINDVSKTNTVVQINSNPTKGSVTVNASNIITFTPNPGYTGNDTFTYVLKTPDGLISDPIVVNLSSKPAGSPDVISIPANTIVTIPVKDNDQSKIGTTVVLQGVPANGTLTLNASGDPVYSPTSTFAGIIQFNYVLRDANGTDSDPILVTVNVKPVGTSDNIFTPVNTPVAIPVKDNDLTKIGTTVIANTTPTHGTIAVSPAGVITYTPATNYSGSDSFTYLLKTADGTNSDPITVNISTKPLGSNDEVTTLLNTPITIPVKANDLSQAGSTVILGAQPSNGTASVNAGGDVLFTPANGFSGKVMFTYTLKTADNFDSDPITVLVNVKPTGITDNIGNVTGTTPIDVKNNDPAKLNTTVVIATPPTQGTVVVGPNGIVTYTPNSGFTGTDSFTYKLRTPDGLESDPITVNLTSKPSGSPDIANTTANVPVTIPVKDNDQSSPGATVVLASNPTNGTVVLNSSGTPIYTPASAFSGKDTFTYKLRDVNGVESDPIVVTVNVKPVGSTDNAITVLNTAVTIVVKDNDLSKAGTTPILVSNPGHGTVAIDASGNAVYVPTTGYLGTDIFTYKLRTSDGIESDPITVNVTISAIVPAPNLTITVPTSAPNVIGIPIPTGGSYTIVTPPTHGTITTDPVTGRPIYTPTPGYSGPDSFVYTIKDPQGNSSTPGTVTITVTKPAKVGLAKALISNTRNADGSYKLSYLFSVVNYGDIAIKNLSITDDLATAFPGKAFTITKLAASGTLRVNTTFNGGTVKEMLLVTSTLSPNFKEQVELDVIIAAGQTGGTFNNTATATGLSTGDGSSTTDVSTNGLTPDPITAGDVTPSTPTTATILIAPSINLPVIKDKPIVVPISIPTGGSYIIGTPPKHGTITTDPITGLPIYTPNVGYSGPDDFTYIIRDANGNESLPATVNATISSPAKIGLAKALISTIRNSDGTYNLIYRFTLVNYGDVAIKNISLGDNLSLAFSGATYQIISVTTSPTSGLFINQGYNGNTALNMLLSTSSMAPTSKQTVDMEVKIILEKDGTYLNFATTQGASASDGTVVNDQSTNGFNPDPVVAGDISPSELTSVTLTKGLFKIPGGFSPNGDGINDFFVIENALGKAINLEVFNRWGNRVYHSKDYQNNWDGKTTEGIYVGNEVPVGTYYYVITIDGADRKVGVLTINR